jgi:hypothetical protein
MSGWARGWFWSGGFEDHVKWVEESREHCLNFVYRFNVANSIGTISSLAQDQRAIQDVAA